MEILDAWTALAAGEGRLPKWLTAILLLPAVYFIPAFYLKVMPMWRTGMPMLDPFRAPGWWPLGSVLWRTTIRILLPLGSLIGPGLLSGAAFYFFPDGSPVVGPAFAVASICVVASLYLQVVVGVFNRSRGLLPPAYRRWPGAWEEWFGGRRFERVESQLEEWERPWKRPWPPLD